MTMTMTSKDLNIAVKRNDGIQYLMSRFGFLQESELYEAIHRVTPVNADAFIRKLEKKQKQQKQHKRRKNVIEEVVPAEEELLGGLTEHDLEEIVDEVIAQEEEIEARAEVEVKEELQQEDMKVHTLEQLLEKEKELSSIIFTMEVEHKSLVSRRRELVEKLQKAQNALRELLRILNEQEKNVTQIYEEYEECASQMESLNKEKKSYAKQLDDVRNKIDELKKVTVFVYANGSIEVENVQMDFCSDSEITSESINLFSMPEAEELTGKEIKTIAKLRLVVDMLQNNDYTFELVFDNARVEKFWETVTA